MLKCQKGMLALELALWLPILLGILILGLTFGKLAYSKMACELSAREAARAYAVNYGIASDCNSIARKVAKDNLVSILPLKREYFDPDTDVTMQEIGDYVQVEVTARVPIEAPYVRKLLSAVGGSIDSHANDAIGTYNGTEYTQRITGGATFKKEAR